MLLQTTRGSSANIEGGRKRKILVVSHKKSNGSFVEGWSSADCYLKSAAQVVGVTKEKELSHFAELKTRNKIMRMGAFSF